MKLKVILFFSIIFFLNNFFSSELEFTYTGKDEYPFLEEYEKGKMFML